MSFLSGSIVDFEQVNGCWVVAVLDHVEELPKVLVRLQKSE